MNKLIFPLTIFAVLVANIARGDDLPFFSTLRGEIVNQLTIASNMVPCEVNKKIISPLLATRWL